jgi:translocation and assembly module TamB
MAAAPVKHISTSGWPPAPGRDWSRLVARFLCGVFAVIGAIPLAVGFLVRAEIVRSWAAKETAALLARELGIKARYDVAVQAWPMLIGLDHLSVEASDGGSPFVTVERVTVRPRPFSLLAGKLDVGEVEITGPRIRAVVEKGQLKNLDYKLPEAPDRDAGPVGLPLSSISITDARIDATLDDVHLDTREIDVDLSVEEDATLEIALRTGLTALVTTHPVPTEQPDAEPVIDDDVICRLDARVRVAGRSVLIRRLTLQGSADFDPEPGTAPSCSLGEHDWRRTEVSLRAVHLDVPEEGRLLANGWVRARIPVPIVHRFVDIPSVTGSLTLDLSANYDGPLSLPQLSGPGAAFPQISGHVSGEYPGFDGKVFSKQIDFDVSTTATGVINVEKLVAYWADGKVTIPEAKVEPLAKGIPLNTGPITIEGLELPGLLRDLGVHPEAHVAWSLERGRIDHFRGTLNPLLLEAPLTISTRGFEIWDRPTTDPLRGHMMSVKEGRVSGVFVINGQERSPVYKVPGVIFSNFSIDTPKSHLRTTFAISFKNTFSADFAEDTRIDLSEISPLVNIPISGQLALKGGMAGPVEHPKITADISIKEFVFGSFMVGDIESGKLAFEPLVLDLLDARIKHGTSRIRSPLTRIAFDKGATVLIDSDIDTRDAPHLRVRDLLSVFRFEKDPRFADIDGTASGKAKIHYALGGPEDRCGGGLLDVRSSMNMENVTLFGERYDEGSLDMDLIWDDQLAGTDGMRLDLRSASLKKGTGGLLANATVRHGGVVQGTAIASGIPIAKFDAFGAYGKLFDGSVSLVADLGGTLSEFEATADVNVSRIRIGPSSLPPSRLRVAMESSGRPPRILGRTRCGNAQGAPFDLGEFEKDLSGGLFRINGSLFDGQVTLDNVRMTRQRHRSMDGKIGVVGLDLGTLANLIPGVAFGDATPKGSLSATLDIGSLPFDAPQRGEVRLAVSRFELEYRGIIGRLVNPSGTIELKGNELAVPDLTVEARLPSGLSAKFVAGGKVHRTMTAPDVDVSARIEPIDLSRISAEIAGVERASGVVDGDLRITGPTTALRYAGGLHVRRGELNLKGLKTALEDINIDLDIGGGDARLRRAEAKVGGGTVTMTGRMPLRGPEAGAASASITARGVKVPVTEGILLTADADLEASYSSTSGGVRGQKNLPDVKGTVSLTSFTYSRPIALILDLSQLGRGQKTAVDSYDPADDLVRFNITVVSPRPLRFSNDLGDMELEVTPPGLLLSGTNQRFGARGQLKILPDSKLHYRSSEFLVREGSVRFDDPIRIAPKFDVRAQTEYRRYASTAAEPSGASADTGSAGATSTSGAGGLWRITLQAHGDQENLKMKLSSDPPLSQEDIILLLTIGLTRAEIDRAQATSLGETVGLEALSTLTGADKAVKTIVPLIDEFRFGSGYSSKTGRTEPTVTLGKRITDNVRATVTTGITENREVRSNVEWRLNRRMSVQGSYDNVNDLSRTLFGNIGADLRWRLEFE